MHTMSHQHHQHQHQLPKRLTVDFQRSDDALYVSSFPSSSSNRRRRRRSFGSTLNEQSHHQNHHHHHQHRRRRRRFLTTTASSSSYFKSKISAPLSSLNQRFHHISSYLNFRSRRQEKRGEFNINCSDSVPFMGNPAPAAEFSFQVPPDIIMKKESSRQQKREELQREVSMLEKIMSHEEKVHEILRHAYDKKDGPATTPLSSSSSTMPNFLPPKTKDLLDELAMVEGEITRLENQIQQLQNDVKREKEARNEDSRYYKLQAGRSNLINYDDLPPPPPPPPPPPSATTGRSSLNQHPENKKGSTSHDIRNIGFETKALHFINKAISGDHTNNFIRSDQKKMGGRVPPGYNTEMRINKENNNYVLHQEMGLQERIMKRGNEMMNPPSPLRGIRHPTPKPRERSMDFSVEVPGKSVYTQNRPTENGQKWLQPNKLSENILKCLILIYVRLIRTSRQLELEKSGPISRSMYSSQSFRSDSRMKSSSSAAAANNLSHKEPKPQDPYSIFNDEAIPRDIGPYKNLVAFTATSLDPKSLSSSTSVPLFQKLRGLLNNLQKVDLSSLTDQQKLAFWINMHNACIMHGYLQYGVPSSPDKLPTLLNKATLNIGGSILNAQAIENHILRKPASSNLKIAPNGERDSKEAIIRELYGIKSLNPNVIFAVSYGTRSSPAVKIYTGEAVLGELEKSKLDYLQASVSVTSTKRIGFPELLIQNMFEFARDMDSLIEWVCHQLPTSGSLRKSMVDCFRSLNSGSLSSIVEKIPYEYEFRYLLVA